MTELHFGFGRGSLPADVTRRVDAIAHKHGCEFVTATIPGNGPQYWFAGPNHGEPFDAQLRDAVLADVASVGIDLVKIARVRP